MQILSNIFATFLSLTFFGMYSIENAHSDVSGATAVSSSESQGAWCTPDKCEAWGKQYSCGVIKCENSSDCGCDCVSTNGSVFYPKAYCGTKSPFANRNWSHYEKRMKKEGAFSVPAFGL